MRIMLAVAALILTLASAACGSDSKSTPTAKAATPVASAGTAGAKPSSTANTPAAGATGASTSPATTSQSQGDVVEVTGIVGGVSLSGKVIEIKRLEGAAVTQIAVDATTIIHEATGGTVRFQDIHTSDRIIAKGKLNDRRDALVATEITVQGVIPGAQPGG
jgi:hypothetical protein